MTFQTNFPLYPTKLPHITLSSKGMSNGLSDIPNDGYDFGPDTLLGTNLKGIYGPPYTQTSGIQEAMNWAFSHALTYSQYAGNFYPIMPEIRLTDGQYNIYTDIYLPLDDSTSTIPTFSLIGNAYGLLNGGSLINLNNHNIYFGKNGYNQVGYGGFKIQGINFYGLTPGLNSLTFAGGFANNLDCILRDIGLYQVGLDMSNVTYLAQLDLDNLQIFLAQIYLGQMYQMSATNLTCKSGLYINGVNQIGVVNMAEGIIIQSGNPSISFNVWEIDSGAKIYGIQNATASGTTSTLNIDIGTLVINQSNNFFTTASSAGTLNIKMHVKHLIFLTAVNNFTVPSGINLQEFTVDEITNLTSTATASANLPILSSASGTTSGTVNMRFTEYAPSHKKMIITFSGYENDTTTNQTINYPLPFNTSAIITGNNTGLTVSTTTSGITITAPNSTTTYSGIVIVEGY